MDQTDLFSHALQTVNEREKSARTAIKNIQQNIQNKTRRDVQSETATRYTKQDDNGIFNLSTDTIFEPRQGQDVHSNVDMSSITGTTTV
jgi:hypothetical protein